MHIMRTLAGAAVAALCVSGGAVAQDDVHVLKVATFTPPTDYINADMRAWAAELEEKSEGRLKLEIFPAGQMGPGPRHFDLARTGVADIAAILHGLTPGRFPMTELALLPGYLSDPLCGAEALSELAPEYLADENPGVKVLNYTAVFPLPIISTKDINEPADLQGLRIRAAGSVQSSLLDAMGAVPVLVAPGDLNDSLSKGSIDAISVGYSGIAVFKLAEVGDYITEVDLGGLTFATVMNQDAFDDLPEDLQALIDETSGVVGSRRITERLIESESGVRANLMESGLDFTLIDSTGALVDGAVEQVAEKQLEALSDPEKGRAFLAAMKERCPG